MLGNNGKRYGIRVNYTRQGVDVWTYEVFPNAMEANAFVLAWTAYPGNIATQPCVTEIDNEGYAIENGQRAAATWKK